MGSFAGLTNGSWGTAGCTRARPAGCAWVGSSEPRWGLQEDFLEEVMAMEGQEEWVLCRLSVGGDGGPRCPLGNTQLKSGPDRPSLPAVEFQEPLSLARPSRLDCCVCVKTDPAWGQGWQGPRGRQILSAPHVGKEVCCVRFKPRTAVCPPAWDSSSGEGPLFALPSTCPWACLGVGWLAGGGGGMRPQWMGEVLGG